MTWHLYRLLPHRPDFASTMTGEAPTPNRRPDLTLRDVPWALTRTCAPAGATTVRCFPARYQ